VVAERTVNPSPKGSGGSTPSTPTIFHLTKEGYAIVTLTKEHSMSHVRKDTFTAPPEWWKHLRPYNKRIVAKRERRAAKKYLFYK
jgi:hypothetical protein